MLSLPLWVIFQLDTGHLENFLPSRSSKYVLWLWCMLRLCRLFCSAKAVFEPLYSRGSTEVISAHCTAHHLFCTTEIKSTL